MLSLDDLQWWHLDGQQDRDRQPAENNEDSAPADNGRHYRPMRFNLAVVRAHAAFKRHEVNALV
ncbi:Uncharacterised protein [Mycobacteroides abscessus subsp. abscessus]|nr:Uncharacterised protein [Mycobacteroides abscessus subsp. abscessus]